MSTIASLIAEVKVTGVNEGKTQLKGMSDSVKETSGGFKGMLGNALSFAAGQVVFNAVGKAVGFLKDQIGSVFQESSLAAAGMAQTTAALKSTHDASGMTAQGVSDLADQMSHLTLFSDDTTQAAENMLLTFTNIGKSVFPQATKTVLDMSQALGQDTKSSAIQLGKALNDPLTGITALQRVGVTFDDSQKKLIKTYMDHNQVAKAQGIILKELQREFGGSAEAAGKTFPGQLQILSQSLDDTKQKIGTALMPVLQQLTGFVTGSIMPAVSKFGDYLSSPAFASFATGVGKDIEDTLKNVGTFAQNNVVPAIGKVVDVIKSPQFADFAKSMGNLGNTVKDVVTGAFKDLKQPVSDLFSFIQTTALPALTNLINGVSGTTSALNNNKPIVAAVAAILTAVFIPAIIASGTQAVIANGKIAVQYVGGIIKTGIEGWQAAGKMAAWIGSIIASGTQAVIAGAKVTASFIGGMVQSGAQAVIAGAKVVAGFVSSLIASGVQAGIAAAAFLSDLIPAIISFAAETLTAAATAIPAILTGFGAWVVGALGVAAANIAAFWPIYLVVGAIIAIIALVVLAIKNWGAIAHWLQGAWSGVEGFFGGLWSNIQNIFGNFGAFFRQKFNDTITDFKNIFGQIGAIAQGIWNGVVNGVKGIINGFIGIINNLINGVNNITGKVGIPAIPDIPLLAKGGSIAQSGWGIVGDAGPELMYMPRGAQVIPNNQLGSGGAQQSSGSGQPVILNIDGRTFARLILPHIVNTIRANVGVAGY